MHPYLEETVQDYVLDQLCEAIEKARR
jgi:hypothetical protein